MLSQQRFQTVEDYILVCGQHVQLSDRFCSLTC